MFLYKIETLNTCSFSILVPSSLFEHKVMALGSLKYDRIVSLSQEDTNNSGM